jgi:pimeloyl-ACP methyl ester carboxylesterase
MRCALLLAGALTLAACGEREEQRPLTDAQRALAARMSAAGATDLKTNGRADGGMSVAGRLEGRAFGIAVPARWNGDATLFANGYSIPGSPVSVPADPATKDPSGGFLSAAYRDGYLIGQSAFDKPAMAVKSGVANTLRLRQWLRRVGARHFYVGGASMGGNIVMALIEKHPDAFVGAMTACGVTGDWETEIGHLVDLRAVYDAVTRGTDYGLPGDHDLTRNAVSPTPTTGLGFTRPAWLFLQIKRMSSPIAKLFAAAHERPDGPEARMIRRIATAANADADPASFMFPIMTAMVGMDDMRASFGGVVYGNAGKRYAVSPAIQRLVGRTNADPRAVRFANRWYRPTGRFTVPLLSVHNPHDGLVFADQAMLLRDRVAASGNDRNFKLLWAPSQQKDIPGTGLKGWAHCGFTPRQARVMWQTLHRWVETGERPDAERY